MDRWLAIFSNFSTHFQWIYSADWELWREGDSLPLPPLFSTFKAGHSSKAAQALSEGLVVHILSPPCCWSIWRQGFSSFSQQQPENRSKVNKEELPLSSVRFVYWSRSLFLQTFKVQIFLFNKLLKQRQMG